MNTTWLWPILACLLASLGACLVLVLTQRWHGKLSLDHDLSGVQKIHDTPVPRVGGIGLALGLGLAGLIGYVWGGESYATAGKLLLCAIPVFTAGLIEDFTKLVGVRTRLIAAFVSAALAFWFIDAKVTDVDTPGLDYLLSFGVISFLFTCFAVGGLTNAVNIIDGINGLAGGSVVIMLGCLGFLALGSGDHLVFQLCMWGTAAVAGFLLINYPFGKIFLGDGGAYLAGFWLAECAVLLMARNPEINTWTVLLCVCYPVVETGYSMFRRQFIQKVSSGSPDSEHMHQLIFKRLSQSLPAWMTHGMTSAAIWLMVGLSQLAVLHLPTRFHLFATIALTGMYVCTHRLLGAKVKVQTEDSAFCNVEVSRS